MTYGAISGMVDSLGDTGHSRFLSPEMVKLGNEAIRGRFRGIGAEVQLKGGHVVIVAPLDGSPAQKASLRPGDVILKVDGRDVTGLPLERVVGRIAGPVGTTVTLTILSPESGKVRVVTLTRAEIHVNNVAWHRVPGTTVADLRIGEFSDGVTRDLERALGEIRKEGASGLILDLRDNPGGLLTEAVGTASQFLEGGNVLLVKDSRGNVAPVPVKPHGLMSDLPMVVLINGGTASGAEIVAGAIQDAHRAKLLGKTTFGTGTVLSEVPLSDGSALLHAIEEWLTPDGHTIWHRGIAPDETVNLAAGVRPLIPEAEHDLTPADLERSGDAQLLRALHLLEARAAVR